MKKLLLSKQNTRAKMQFAIKALGKDQAFWSSVLKTDQSTVEMFSYSNSRHVCRKLKTVFQKNLIATVMHGGGNIMVWG